MQAFDNSERRKYQRLVGGYLVYYKIKGPSEKYNLTRTKNISRGGMLLTVDKPFEKGTDMEFTIRGPFTQGTAIEMTGVVLDSRKIVEDLVYEARIQFSDPDAKSLDKLDEFIKRSSEGH
ncbi:MAG: PilZ domain-containing protein [Candidatus Omnitrophota bacterium]